MAAPTEWKPNPGPQTAFLACSAFEALYGGSAGGGKSEAILMGACRHVDRPGYRALLLRRTYPELKRSLIDRSAIVYPGMGATYNVTDKVWRFPAGGLVEFGALEYENDVQKYQSAEYQFIAFDELTTFTERQYTYMISRLRSTTGIPLRLRAATNPGNEGHEWVLRRFAPWLYPPRHRDYHGRRAAAGERLHFRTLDDGGEVWCDPNHPDALSRTFFPAMVSDNPYLAGTSYERNLDMLDPVTRARLKWGDWMARPAAGMYFKREWLEIVGRCPHNVGARVRYWDRASGETQKHDATAGLRLSVTPGGLWFIEDVVHFRGRPHEVEARMTQVAKADVELYGMADPYDNPGGVALYLERDPAQAGAMEAEYYSRQLAEYAVRFVPPQGNKILRAQPVSAQAEARNVFLVRGEWNEGFIGEAEAFPDGPKDQIDSLSGAFRQALALRVTQDGTGDATAIEADEGGALDDIAQAELDERQAEAARERARWGYN